ncbi:hypothetical protein SSP24_84290 [Streptomyces spinoverrucosus]|uniref:DUF732 domain-containing protein n=1 Tax=Streptomyces spinoverrucosus TaxID=284043 RepID=A0A4Y3VUY1_9ACTN|nr:hypothetical protein [Streptomyces spinoverrucosus]GEC10774.1 hypothetical protein SSP24_84290 [Streptomyces spinoverrucosus]GHB71259.1 hypothetical protein GCM10010397_47050 [Streptomyces spinoverrucosus]
MRIRTTTAVVTAVLAVSLVGCSSDNGTDSKADTALSSAPAAPNTADSSDTSEADKVALPEPTGDKRTAVIAAIKDVNPKLAQDEDKAIEKARYQCVNLDGGVLDTVNSAMELFSYDGVMLTEDDARHLNIGLRNTLCPET